MKYLSLSMLALSLFLMSCKDHTAAYKATDQFLSNLQHNKWDQATLQTSASALTVLEDAKKASPKLSHYEIYDEDVITDELTHVKVRLNETTDTRFEVVKEGNEWKVKLTPTQVKLLSARQNNDLLIEELVKKHLNDSIGSKITYEQAFTDSSKRTTAEIYNQGRKNVDLTPPDGQNKKYKGPELKKGSDINRGKAVENMGGQDSNLD